MDRQAKIIALNDQLRTSFNGGRVQMTPSVYELDARLRGRALSVLARYNKFHPDSEHDWGTFIFAGFSFEWRIEYRGKNGTGISPDPADPDKTFRVLTLFAIDDVFPADLDRRCPRARANASAPAGMSLLSLQQEWKGNERAPHPYPHAIPQFQNLHARTTE